MTIPLLASPEGDSFHPAALPPPGPSSPGLRVQAKLGNPPLQVYHSSNILLESLMLKQSVHWCLLAFLVPLLAFAAPPEIGRELRVGIVHGEGGSFAFQAPDGWTLDWQSGADQGLPAVLYPKGGSWSDSPVVMYATLAKKDPSNLDAFISDELARLRESSGSGLKVEKGKSIATQGDRNSAHVRNLSGAEHGNFESVAYIEEKKTYVRIVLSSRNRATYEESLDDFEELVGSYKFLAESLFRR